jgi:hypothetical protein
MRLLCIFVPFFVSLSTSACGDDDGTSDTGPADTGTTDASVGDGDVDAVVDTAPPCPPPDPGGDAPSFAADVYPIIAVSCAPCHTLSPSGGLAMLDAESAYCMLVNVESTCMGAPRVVPGDAASSYLIEKITNDTPTCGLRMPRSGPPYLEPADIAVFEAWIDEGARP